ncbi:MAG: hypothetical protein M3N57_03470 [Actinomycetota bacterium]|nr:hypothetical protein [Actinomycetota bacterium]
MAEHLFRPGDDLRNGEVFVLARCSCGWEGAAYPEPDQGYADAQLEFDDHLEDVKAEEPPAL